MSEKEGSALLMSRPSTTDTCFCPSYSEAPSKPGRCRNCFHSKELHSGGLCAGAIAITEEQHAEAEAEALSASDAAPVGAYLSTMLTLTMPTPDGASAAPPKGPATRQAVIDELVETERTYLAGLRDLASTYARPAREGGVLSVDECSSLFANAETLVPLHEELLTRLSEAREGLGTVAAVFLKLAPMLRMYKVYSSNYTHALQLLEELCRSADGKWMQFCRGRLGDGRGAESVVLVLTSLLITPVQRVPRYVLLLADARKRTPAADPEYEELGKALDLLNEIADEINQYMSRGEHATRALQIQHSLIGGKVPRLLEAHRAFVREGDLHKITSRFVTTCHLFLFSDILLYSHQKLGPWAWKYKGCVAMGPCWARKLPDTPRVRNIFQIVMPRKTWTFYAATPAEKSAWVAEINRVVEVLAKNDPSLLEARADVSVNERGGIWKKLASSKVADVLRPQYVALEDEYENEHEKAEAEAAAALAAATPKAQQMEIGAPSTKAKGGSSSESSCCSSCTIA